MYFDEFARRCSAGDLPAFLLMAGEAEDVLEESQRILREAFLRAHPDGSVRVFDGSEQDVPEVLSDACSASLFAANRLLLLRKAERCLGQRQGEAAMERLTEYLRDPNPLSVVAFCARGLRKQAKIARFASEQGWFVQCGELPPWKAASWIVSAAGEMGLRLSGDAALPLLEKVGNDMGLLRSALEQLSVSVHPRREAGVREVRDLPVPGGMPEAFDFLDEAAPRKTGPALRRLAGIQRDPSADADAGLLFRLVGRIREFLHVAACREEGMSMEQAAQAIPMHPYRLRGMWDSSRSESVKGWEDALEGTIRLAAGQVTGRFSKDAILTALERWILGKRHGRRVRRP